jgi:hypothetical protein
MHALSEPTCPATHAGDACERKLGHRGIVEYVDHGRIEDDNGDAERPIYAITDRGRALLAKLSPVRVGDAQGGGA